MRNFEFCLLLLAGVALALLVTSTDAKGRRRGGGGGEWGKIQAEQQRYPQSIVPEGKALHLALAVETCY